MLKITVVIKAFINPIRPITDVSDTKTEIEQNVDIRTKSKVTLLIFSVYEYSKCLYNVETITLPDPKPRVNTLYQNCCNIGPIKTFTKHTSIAMIKVCWIPNLKWTRRRPKARTARTFVKIYSRAVVTCNG